MGVSGGSPFGSQIQSKDIADGAVTTAKISGSSISTALLQLSSVSVNNLVNFPSFLNVKSASTSSIVHLPEFSTLSAAYVLAKTITLPDGLLGSAQIFVEMTQSGVTSPPRIFVSSNSGADTVQITSTGSQSYSPYFADAAFRVLPGASIQVFLGSAAAADRYWMRNFRIGFQLLTSTVSYINS